LVTQTSLGRYHGYWFVADATLEQFKPTQQRLAKLMEGDPSVCDLPRVMRLPGFPNQKDPARPFLTTIAFVESRPPYVDADFKRALAEAEALFATINTKQRDETKPSSPPDMRQGYRDGDRTRELLRRAGWCLAPWNMSEEQAVAECLEWNQQNIPPLPDEKIRATIASIAKAEAKKHTAVDTKQDSAGENERDPTQREKLILIGLNAELWHDKDGNIFATVKVDGHEETFAIKSSAFRHWLTREFGKRYPIKIGTKTCPSAPSTQSLTEAINALCAQAASGPEYQAAVRVAGYGGLIYLDLGTPECNAVEISPDGWRIVSEAPIRFIRPPGFRPLPVPIRGGNIVQLSQFLNVVNRNDFVMIVAWLLAALRPTGPYPILVINGEQGAGKTLACRVLRRLIDPNGAELRTDTRDERDLLLAAKNGWIVALDNLSYVRNDLSDAICRIASKGAFATRALYTNDEEFLLEVCRPMLLNGIPPLASRADLADRTIISVFPSMDDSKRQSEEEFWSKFDKATAGILGALLDGVSGALRSYQSIQLNHPCRMMDFAKWAEAGCRALGCDPGVFEEAYVHNRSSATEDALDADPLAGAVVQFMSGRVEFIGTATELLSTLEAWVLPAQRDRRWPRDATRLSSHIRRLPPLLRPRGITFDFDDRSTDSARKRLIRIKKVGAK
jgi:hypothetical protein